MLGTIGNFRIRLFRLTLCLIAFFCLFLSGGCKSVSEKVEEHLEKQDFASARLLLEEEGVGLVPVPDADEEDLAARDSFEQEVRVHYRSIAERLLGDGKVRGGLAATREGLNFCPWSEGLQSDAEGYAGTVRDLDGLKQQWSSVVFDSSVDITVARGLAADLEQVRKVLGDTWVLEAALQVSTERIGRWWAEEIHEVGGRLSTQQQRELTSEFKRLPVDGDSTNVLGYFLREFSVLPRHAEQEAAVELSRIPGALSSIENFTSRLRHEAGNRQWGALRPCVESLVKYFDLWQSSDLFAFFDSEQVSFATLSLGEKLLGGNKGMRALVSQAHLHRARQRAGEGHQAVLALMHIERVRQIGAWRAGLADELDALERVAQASSSVSLPQKIKVWIDIDPEVDPLFYEVLKWVVFSEIQSRSTFENIWVSAKSPDAADFVVNISSASFLSPKPTDLTDVSSRYHSHFQNAPNPEKARLKQRLVLLQIALGVAEGNYNAAVTQHNIYRTVYSLNRVNTAKTLYLVALAAHNSVVAVYNSTPSTIQQAVYLSYSFKEGKVHFGWKVEAHGRINKSNFRFAEESVESDFCRFGTRLNDENVNYRRDDSLDIDRSWKRVLAHLRGAISSICDQANPLLAEIEYEERSELHPDERAVMGWLLHPWGIQEGVAKAAGFPDWISGIAGAVELKSVEHRPPEIVVPEGEFSLDSGLDLDAEAIARNYESLVCRVSASDGVASSSGSGTLISGDGLILTCAHVLNGPKLKVHFYSGEWKGEYEAKIVFENGKNDVALLRAQNLHTKRWAPIRLEGDARRGEKIVAVGNPAIPDGTINILGTSVGVVSNSRAEVYGQDRLVADINVSSGSSGGPIISMADGSVLGVVTAVLSAKIDKTSNFSTSGFSCLAAPASRLPEWLGLRTGSGEQKDQPEDLSDIETEEEAAAARTELRKKLVRDKLQQIKSEDESTRQGASEFFRGIDGEYWEATAILMEALKDQDHRVRATAAYSLGKIGRAAKDAIPQLRILLEDSSSVVQKYARRALGELESGDE